MNFDFEICVVNLSSGNCTRSRANLQLMVCSKMNAQYPGMNKIGENCIQWTPFISTMFL